MASAVPQPAKHMDCWKAARCPHHVHRQLAQKIFWGLHHSWKRCLLRSCSNVLEVVICRRVKYMAATATQFPTSFSNSFNALTTRCENAHARCHAVKLNFIIWITTTDPDPLQFVLHCFDLSTMSIRNHCLPCFLDASADSIIHRQQFDHLFFAEFRHRSQTSFNR